MRKIMLLAVLLAGCATPPPPFIVEGTETAVSVNWANSTHGTTGALQAAENHCSKYGRHAQYVGKSTDFDLNYNCIKS